MRKGYNPHKDRMQEPLGYLHQIIIPVYIPNHEDYFKDSFAILKMCLESLFKTIHKKTFVSIINNGSDKKVSDYLDSLLFNDKIHELIHTENIGKLNAILKGLMGNAIPLVTISDSDVLFLPNWQKETVTIFKSVSKAGVVGIVPQFKTYESFCGNVLFDMLFSSKLSFIEVKNKQALIRFYDSLGWNRNYNQNYLQYVLGLEINPDLKVLIGSGHFVATYKKDIFEGLASYFEYKMGGNSEKYIDKLPLRKDYWRLTTQDNYAYHMGNTIEDWMTDMPKHNEINNEIEYEFKSRKRINSVLYFIKNRLFVKFISNKFLVKIFLKWKKLPKSIIDSY
jgi:hypothetical protein